MLLSHFLNMLCWFVVSNEIITLLLPHAMRHPVILQGELCNCGVIDGHDFGCLLQVLRPPIQS